MCRGFKSLLRYQFVSPKQKPGILDVCQLVVGAAPDRRDRNVTPGATHNPCRASALSVPPGSVPSGENLFVVFPIRRYPTRTLEPQTVPVRFSCLKSTDLQNAARLQVGDRKLTAAAVYNLL